MARLLALTALVLAASSAVGSGPASAAASGSSHGLLSAAPAAADDHGCDATGSVPVDAAPAPRGWVDVAPLGAGDGDPSSPAQVAAPALAPLALAPKTSPPLAARR